MRFWPTLGGCFCGLTTGDACGAPWLRHRRRPPSATPRAGHSTASTSTTSTPTSPHCGGHPTRGLDARGAINTCSTADLCSCATLIACWSRCAAGVPHEGPEQGNQGGPRGGIGPVHPEVGGRRRREPWCFQQVGFLFGRRGMCVEAGVARALPSIPQGERRFGTRANGGG